MRKNVRCFRNSGNFQGVGRAPVRLGSAGVRDDGGVMKAMEACYLHLWATCLQGQRARDLFEWGRPGLGQGEKER